MKVKRCIFIEFVVVALLFMALIYADEVDTGNSNEIKEGHFAETKTWNEDGELIEHKKWDEEGNLVYDMIAKDPYNPNESSIY